MKIVVFNYVTHELIGELKTKRLKSLFDFTQILNTVQQQEDFLGLGFTCPVIDAGIQSYSSKGFVMSNDANVIKAGVDKHAPAPVKIISNGEEQNLDLRLLVTAYEEGFIINVGKMATSILGSRLQLYVGNAGKRKLYFNPLGKCRVFPTMKSVYDYLLKYKDILQKGVDEGYTYSVEPACKAFEVPETKQNAKYVAKVFLLLDEINSYGEEDDEQPTLTGTASADEMQQEALERLKGFNVHHVVIDGFLKEKLYMSEFGGILYDLNKNAEKAIEKVKETGRLPFAIVRTQTNIGDMYAVLYVSSDKEEWAAERKSRKDICRAYVYNASAPECSELGDIEICGENGGLIRYM